MVDIPVHDRNPMSVDSEFRCGDGDVVHEAETHRPVGDGVMTRRATCRERHITRTSLQCIDRVEHGTRSAACGVPRPRRRERVGIEIAAAALAETFELRHVTGRMHTLQLGNRGQPRCAELDGVAQSGRFDARQRRTQSPRAFGVPLGCRVLVEFGVRKDDDGRCHPPTLETPTLRPTDVTPVPGGARS